MDPFFLPLPVVPPPGSECGYENIHRLEQYLDVALCLLRKTAERLQTTLGPEALDAELSRFLAGNDPIALSMVISRIDSLVEQKGEAKAVRLIRELFGVTWDQALDFYSYWSQWDQGQKLRYLQAVELRKLFASYINSSRETPIDGHHRESPANRSQSP